MKVFNTVVNGSSNDQTTLTLNLEVDNMTPIITEENFESFFGITFEKYISLRENINDFYVQIKAYNEGSLLYDTFLLGAFFQKANMLDGSYNDHYNTANSEIGSFLLNIQTNTDKTFKSCSVEATEQ